MTTTKLQKLIQSSFQIQAPVDNNNIYRQNLGKTQTQSKPNQEKILQITLQIKTII
jgi:hypothetical protein